MKVLIPEGIGFCFGVERALKMLNDAIESAELDGHKVFSLGHIIHNEFVIESYLKQGVIFVEELEELRERLQPGDYVLIRSHGIPKYTLEELKAMHAKLIDGTCPYVRKVHDIVRRASEDGDLIVILGYAKHPEIIGTLSYAKTDVIVISDPDNVRSLQLRPDQYITVVSQTTERYERFQQLVTNLRERFGEDRVRIFNTICHVTKRNQMIAHKMAEVSQLVLVVGGKSSSNTRKLYQLAKSKVDRVYHITYPYELDYSWFRDVEVASIISGASTPRKLIMLIANLLRDKLKAELFTVDPFNISPEELNIFLG